MLHVPASTLRYYDKEGLLPSVERTSGGIRMFKDDDIEWLRIIDCLKKSGMSIRDIREYIALVAQGDSTINERLQLFYRQREILKAQMRELQKTLDTLDYNAGFMRPQKRQEPSKSRSRWRQRNCRKGSGVCVHSCRNFKGERT